MNEQSIVHVGLIGAGIGESLSPALHEAEGQRLGIDYHYRLMDVDLMKTDLLDCLGLAEYEGFRGVNVTHPFKVSVIDALTDISPEANAIGAVNTVVFENGRRTGYNTDGWGFKAALERNLSRVAMDRVLMVGAGGAGMACGYALLQSGVIELMIIDIDTDRAFGLRDRLQQQFPDADIRCAPTVQDLVGAEIDGLVNATPVGMDAHPGLPMPQSLLQPHRWLIDVIYFPRETELIRVARKAGCQAFTGAEMAIGQAVRAFELFSGRPADFEQMRKTFRTLAQSASRIETLIVSGVSRKLMKRLQSAFGFSGTGQTSPGHADIEAYK